MKKLFILFASFSLVLSLTACGNNGNGDETPDNEPTISGVGEVNVTVGDTFSVLDGVSATDTEDGDLTSSITTSGTVDTATVGIYTVTYSVTDSDNNTKTATRTVNVVGLDGCPVYHDLVDGTCVKRDAETITIMHGAVYEIDPFHEAYSGTEQLERQEHQRAIEAEFNVVINYENYPPSAAWGPNRINAIIQASVSGEPMSDIYWVTSDWLQQLVEGDALADVSGYMNTIGANIPAAYSDIGEFQGGIYGFESYQPTINTGLYYNADLVDSLGVDNPTDLYLDGDWDWSTFETWATSVQTALDAQPDDMYALGGMLSYYAEGMIPLNGGSLINKSTGRVAFAQKPALDTYDFLTTLWEKGLYEPNGQYDAGSPEWQTGKVVMHPGDLWFINASNRWGGLAFELGFVPFPVADDYTGDYISPISGVAVMSLAKGMEPEREELVFEVWNALQIWKTEQEASDDFELSLLTKFDDEKYIEAYLEVYDKVYLDVLNAIGISAYGENGWARNINSAIKDGSSRTAVDSIAPIYSTALEDYLGD